MHSYIVKITDGVIDQIDQAKSIYARYGTSTPQKFEDAFNALALRLTFSPFFTHIYDEDPTVRFVVLSRTYHYTVFVRIDEFRHTVFIFLLEWSKQHPANIRRKVSEALFELNSYTTD